MSSHPSSTGFLKAKIQIGNSKGPVEYQLKQTVFHHDDVPKDRRKRVEEIKEYARRKILDDTPTWNKSSKSNELVCERRQMENYAQDRSHQYTYNYRAETLDPMRNIEPLDKSTKFHVSVQLETTAKEIMRMKQENPVLRGRLHRTQELPNHPDLVDATPWNATAVLTLKELHNGLEKKTKHAQEWTGKVNETLKLKRSYVSPMQQTILMQEKIRQQKCEGTFSASELINPPRKAPEMTYVRTNREQNDKMRKVKLTEHSGVWGPNSVDGRSMWSDTGSYKFRSRGDVVKTVNLDQSNLIDPVKGSRREEPSTMKVPPLHYSERPGTTGAKPTYETGNNAITLSSMSRGGTA